MTLKNHPLLITFEGGEGAGKSTLIEHLLARFEKLNYQVMKTREPGGTLLGEQVRNLLLHQDKYPIGSISEILLFLTSRSQQIQEVIKPHLDKGYVVLCDRYNDSTIAYQGIARGVGQRLTQELCTLACNYLEPDLTFVLDLDPKVGLNRTQKMEKEWDRLESLDLTFHEKVRGAYLKLAKEKPNRIVLIDASLPAQAVIEQCWQAIEKRLLVRT